MTDRGTAPPPIGALARAAAAGCIGGALSVQRHETAIRRLGLLLATGTGAWTALTAGGVVTPPAAGRSSDDGPRPVPPAAAAALGVGMFAVAAGASEVGLRGQRRLERWAERTNGHPRLTIGVLSAAAALVIDAADRDPTRS